MTESFKYRAFISYSHADEAWAAWLHRRLEHYRVPSHLVGRKTANGPVPRRLGRCFRDQAELSAASDLTETLRQALRDSQSLIIVCSPRSAASRWVNEEIKYFRSLGRGGAIYAFIVDGEPNAHDPAQESFPRALLQDEDGRLLSEPLAADARPAKDGKVDGFLKLVSGLIGVGFDELRQREQKRRTRLMTAAVGASLAIASITTVLAINAYRARGEAELRRQQADDLINYMLGDLTERLVPVGRLDVLDAVTGKLMSYLNATDVATLDDSALAQRIQVLMGVADIRDKRAQMTEAHDAADEAVRNARELVRRNPAGFESRYLLATALAKAASIAANSDEHGVARTLIDEGRAYVAHLRQERPDDDRLPLLSARLLSSSGLSHARQSRYEEQMVDSAACAEELRPFLRRKDLASEVARQYILCKSGLASRMHSTGAIEEARDALDELLPEIADLLERHPEDVALLGQTAEFTGTSMLAYRDAGLLDRAEQVAQEGLPRNRRLVAHDPTNAEWRFSLGTALVRKARLELIRSDWVAMHEAAEEAFPLFAELARIDPANDWFQIFLAQSLNARGMSLAMQGNLARALADWEVVARTSGQEQVPTLQLYRATAWLLIWEWAADSDPARARIAQEGAREILQKMAEEQTNAKHTRLLKERQMVFSYLSGDVAGGDQLFSELRQINRENFSENTMDRRRLCGKIARRKGPRCAQLEEWKPLDSAKARDRETAPSNNQVGRTH